MLYWLTEWEHNGRDDSDWYAVIYNSETNNLERYEIGTTRFANAHPCTGRLADGTTCETNVPEEILLKAEACLSKIIYEGLSMRDKLEVLKPDQLEEGVMVRILEDYSIRIKAHDTIDCKKCNGSGKWANPNNLQDIRNCFNCHGSGHKLTNFRPLRRCSKCKHEFAPFITEDEKLTGKKLNTSCPNCKASKNSVRIIRKVIKVNTVGTALSSKAYGTFYANGYNKPNRFNTTVKVKFEEETVFIPLEKLRLAQELKTEDELKQLAKARARKRNFYVPFRTASIGMI